MIGETEGAGTGSAELRTMAPEAARLMRQATYASVTVAGILIAAKMAAWLATDSVSMLSTLLDSVLDAAASMVNLVAVRHALKYGRGLDEKLADEFVGMYVNDLTLDYGEAGRRSVELFLTEAAEAGIIPKKPELVFV